MTFTTIVLGPSSRLTLSDQPSGFLRMKLVTDKDGVDLNDLEIRAIATALRAHGRGRRSARAADGVVNAISVPRQHDDE